MSFRCESMCLCVYFFMVLAASLRIIYYVKNRLGRVYSKLGKFVKIYNILIFG